MNLLVKSEEETNSDYGCRPGDRTIDDHIQNGIVIIDKPAGPTSHQVSDWVKKILKVGKAGHSGTLDPRVTGVLPVAIMDSTRVLGTLLLTSKEYVGVMRLHEDVPAEKLSGVFREFTGEIHQKPPLKSAVKRELRVRKIYGLEVLEKEGVNVLFRVECEAGTYIRKLCHDMGLVLGVGAHMQELRRTRVANFDESVSVTLQDLKDAYEFFAQDGSEKMLRKFVLPVEDAVSHLRRIWLKDSAIDAVCHGASLNAPGVAKLESGIGKGEPVALLSLKGELVAIAGTQENSGGIHGMNRGVVAELERVVMKPCVYPKKWKSK